MRQYEKQNGLPPLPILITSGNNSPADNVVYAAAGADGVIPKPIDMAALLSDIDRFFQVRESGLPAKLIPPESLGNVELPIPEDTAESRARRITQLSSALGAYPWRESLETGGSIGGMQQQ